MPQRVCILTLGCKVNQYESGQIAADYVSRGAQVFREFIPDADLYIVNTCAVTAHAEKKSRNYVAKCKRACGSNVTLHPCGVRDVSANSGVPAPNNQKVIVCGCAGDRSVNERAACNCAVQNRKRAFIKVQDGCNNFCSYCIVPYIRGRSRSRPIADVVAEMRAANKSTVISGIDLSSYGLDIGTDLGALCESLDALDLPFELSSVEVGILSDKFIKALKSCRNFIPNFHVPLQSGSDKVLLDMNRKYTRDGYMDAIARVRAAFPNARVSTDVIIGYPTETPADLAATHDVIARVNFDKVHTFPYSDRKRECLAHRYANM